MKDKIAILIPTRERLDDFIIFAKSWKENTEGLSDVIVRIDYDDKTYEEIKKEYPEFIYEYGEKKPFLHLLNEIAVKYSEIYNYVGFMEDDCNFKTKGWESSFINKLKDLGDLGIVWAEDLVNGESIIGLPFMSSYIVRKLGFMCPYELDCLVADHYWKDLANALGKYYYFRDITIEHRHYSTGKRDKDNISEILENQAHTNNDWHRYYSGYKLHNFRKDLEEKLLK